MTGRRSKRMIGSGIGRLLAVIDSAAEADAAVEALVASGIERARIERFDRPEDAPAFDVSGRGRGWIGRLFRVLEFSWADQAPDRAWYEAAVREGRVVLSVPVRGQGPVAGAARIIEENGGHFINHLGWFETQELAKWKGREPDVPGFLRR